MELSLIQNFGYCEMYECATTQKDRFGRFVTFDKTDTDKITFAAPGDYVIGVSSINFAELSDNPKQWPAKYYRDQYGDCVLDPTYIAVGHKKYDQMNEMAYISTEKLNSYRPRQFKYYDKNKKYVERIDRLEWCPVTLIGKAMVIDDGTCVPGQYCQLYSGNDESRYGTAESWPSGGDMTNRWYVIERFSKNTIKILYK